MNITSSFRPKRNHTLKSTFAPPIYITIVLIADYIVPVGTFTPFFAVVGLMIMALTLKPSRMIPWAFLYVAIVCSIFLSPRLHVLFTGKPYPDQAVVPLIRAATYVTVGFLSCYLCFVLNRLRDAQEEMAVILNKLPSAILVSNQNGKILYCNNTARELIPDLDKRRGFYSFFELLAPPNRQGKSISEYLQRLESDDHEQALDLWLYDRPLKGDTRVLDWMGERVLLTILTETQSHEGPESLKSSE